MTLDEVADELYGLPPEDFTAARDAVAKAAEPDARKAVKALRKPTVSAYVVNLLVRLHGDDLEDLVSLGDEMRAAMGGKGDLRALTEQRRTAIAALVRSATDAAARDLTAAIEEEVAATLEAATADPEMGRAVLSGHLVKPLRYAGFGAAPDLADVVATPLSDRRRPKTAAPAKRATKKTPAKTTQKAATTTATKAAAKRAPDDAAKAKELTRLRSHVLELSGRADDAQRRYEQAMRAAAEARKLLDAAEKERADAHREANEAHREAERARRELGKLERR